MPSFVDLERLTSTALVHLAYARHREETAEAAKQLHEWDELLARVALGQHSDPETAGLVRLMMRTTDIAVAMTLEEYFDDDEVLAGVIQAAVQAGLPHDLAERAARMGMQAALEDPEAAKCRRSATVPAEVDNESCAVAHIFGQAS